MRIRRFTSLLFLYCLLASAAAYAGGSYEEVYIETFIRQDRTNFTLVIKPIHQETASRFPDPYIGRCEKLTVHGTYNRLTSWLNYPKFVTRSMHLAALDMIESARITKKPLNFGWMGGGFHVPDRENPCVVESGALWVSIDRETTAILSFYNPV